MSMSMSMNIGMNTSINMGMNTMQRIIMNIPPPLPLMRSSAICIKHDKEKEKIEHDWTQQEWILNKYGSMMENTELNAYRKQPGGFIDIDKPYNIDIPSKLNRQVSV